MRWLPLVSLLLATVGCGDAMDYAKQNARGAYEWATESKVERLTRELREIADDCEAASAIWRSRRRTQECYDRVTEIQRQIYVEQRAEACPLFFGPCDGPNAVEEGAILSEGASYRTPFTRENLDEHYEPWGYVAHALGTIDGEAYTNSLEVFLDSYERGFRVFEVDLVSLRDGSVLAAHDHRRFGLTKRFWQLDADEIPKKYLERYTVLFERDLLRLIQEHPDVYLILDPKGRNEAENVRIVARLVSLANQDFPGLADRFIPHVSSQPELDALEAMYPFKDYIACLYRSRLDDEEAAEFVRSNGIRAVMMLWRRRYSPELNAAMREAGAVVYVHSLSEKDVEGLLQLRALGVGAYTNGVYLQGGES